MGRTLYPLLACWQETSDPVPSYRCRHVGISGSRAGRRERRPSVA
jgi:hypothetical protein